MVKIKTLSEEIYSQSEKGSSSPQQRRLRKGQDEARRFDWWDFNFKFN
jgi:hypothetical protein